MNGTTAASHTAFGSSLSNNVVLSCFPSQLQVEGIAVANGALDFTRPKQRQHIGRPVKVVKWTHHESLHDDVLIVCSECYSLLQKLNAVWVAPKLCDIFKQPQSWSSLSMASDALHAEAASAVPNVQHSIRHLR